MTLVVTLLAVLYFVCKQTLVNQFSTDIGKKYNQAREYFFSGTSFSNKNLEDKEITAG